MGKRLDLDKILRNILGTSNVYFQPPSTIKMEYPCIVYSRSDIATYHADNRPYIHKKQYTVTYIDKNPDSEIPDKLSDLPTCEFDRHYVADNLNHDVFILYY